MSLRTVNLNLIPILQMLLRHRSVALAAEALDISPAATSESLGRLRLLLNDQLLVRVGRTMQLTPKAVELIEPVNQLCEHVEGLLHFGEGFDPRHSKRQFKLASIDSLIFMTAQPIMHAIQEVAPAVQVHFVDVQPDVCLQMSAREIDMMLVPKLFTEQLTESAPIRIRTLQRDRMVIVFSARHPLALQAEVSAEDLALYPQVLYSPVAARRLDGRREREAFGVTGFNAVVRVPQLMQIPYLVASPPYVAWVPESVAKPFLEPLQLQTRAASFSATNLDVCLCWSPVQEKDPAHIWLRNLITATLTQS